MVAIQAPVTAAVVPAVATSPTGVGVQSDGTRVVGHRTGVPWDLIAAAREMTAVDWRCTVKGNISSYGGKTVQVRIT